MAIVSPDQVLVGFIKALRETVGSRLSTLPVKRGTDPIPAVIKDRPIEGVRPDYPFIVVDFEDSDEEFPASVKDEYFDENTGKLVIVTEETLTLNIKCFGKESSSILTEQRIRANFDKERWRINELTGAVFGYYGRVNEVPAFLSTKYIQCAEMKVTLTAESKWSPTDDDATCIERVQGEGEYLHYEGDENPLSVSFDEPQ